MNGMNTVTVAYDGAGNLTRDWGGRSFTYDGENRMVSFDTLGTDDDTTYYYDGEGRRVKKAVGGTGGPETIYVYNVAGQLVAEYATRRRPLSGTQYLTQDHLGSTRAVTGPDGAAVSRHDYLPFGEEILGRGGRTTALKYAADSMSGPAQKFTGKERDTESGLDSPPHPHLSDSSPANRRRCRSYWRTTRSGHAILAGRGEGLPVWILHSQSHLRTLRRGIDMYT